MIDKMEDDQFERLCDFLAAHGVFFWDFYENYPEEGKTLIDAKRAVHDKVNIYVPFFFEKQELIVQLTDEQY